MGSESLMNWWENFSDNGEVWEDDEDSLHVAKGESKLRRCAGACFAFLLHLWRVCMNSLNCSARAKRLARSASHE